MSVPTRSVNRSHYCIVVILLGTLVALCLVGIQFNSPTLEEPIHIARGYHYLITGKLAFDTAPPLINVLCGVPILFRRGIIIPPLNPVHKLSLPEFADELVWVYNDAEMMINSGRLTIILLSALLGYFVFRWARELWGIPAGLLALFLYVLDPNILAHSQLATADLGATFFIFVSLYFMWRFLCWRRNIDLVVAGLLLGLAQAAKLSALLLFPLVCVAMLIEEFLIHNGILPGFWSWSAYRAKLSQAVYLCCGILLVLFGLAFFSLWVCYRFEVVPLADLEPLQQFVGHLLPHPTVRNIVESRILPLSTYLRGLRLIQRRLEQAIPIFLMGRQFSKGLWYHMPVAFIIKTPIPTLLLLVLAVGVTICGVHGVVQREYIVYLPILAFFLASVIFSSFNLSYRHILPVLPFAFVFVSKITKWDCGHLGRLTLVLLCLWHAIGTVHIYPHCLAYFNELVGGPENGYKYLVGSDLDWGQDLKNLKVYMDQNSLDMVYLAYFGSAHPEYYDIQAQPLPTEKPESMEANRAQVYAISATYLQGSYLEDVDKFSWLRQYTPWAKVGYSIFLYRLP